MRGCFYRGNSGYSPFQCACPPPNLLFNIRMYIYYRAFCIYLSQRVNRSSLQFLLFTFRQNYALTFHLFLWLYFLLFPDCIPMILVCVRLVCLPGGLNGPSPPLSWFIYAPFPHKHFLAIVNATLMI